MFQTGFFSTITKIVTGTTLVSLITVTCPDMTKAELPFLEAPEAAEPVEEISSPLLDSQYRLTPGDRIRIQNVESPEFSGDHQIPPGGEITLPMIGTVPIEGLTLQEATDLITAKYRRFFKYPLVSIYIQAIAPIEIVVAGEVSVPGTYIMSREDLSKHRGIQLPTVMEAIQRSGGIPITGDPRRVQVRRTQNHGSEQVITVDLWAFLQTGNQSQNINLQNGDTILVPPTTEVNLSLTRQLVTAPFAADISTPRTVAVVGEVARPGSYVVQGGDTQLDRRSDGLPTVIRAIQLAGGVSASADIRQVQIRRIAKSGMEQIFSVDLWKFFQEGDLTQDAVIQAEDTIVIPTAQEVQLAEIRQLRSTSLIADIGSARTVNVVGEVIRPGPYAIRTRDPVVQRQVDGLPTVTRALQLAGGITPAADIRRIQIRRPTRTGAEQILNVDLWQLLQTGDLNQDVLLEEGDTVVVPSATEINPAEAVELAAASFSPDKITVYIVGEAVGSRNVPAKPEIQLPPNTPLSQALLASAAFNMGRANQEQVELIRLNADGTVTQRMVSPDLTAGINDATNPLLRDKDIIVVQRSGGTKLSETLQTVGESTLFIARFETLLRVLSFLGIIENQTN